MIPKIIHQIWIGDQSKKPEKIMNTWKIKHPDWEYKIWTEENLPSLKNQKQFNQMEELAGKADILRYELLYNYGGVYIDADTICLNSLDDFFLKNDSFTCWENEYCTTGLIHNGHLGACPNNELMKELINYISLQDQIYFGPLNAWKVTGPVLITNMVRQLRYTKLRIYPSYYFIPEHFSGVSHYYTDDKCYGKHLNGSTPNSKFKYGQDESEIIDNVNRH
jgi:mannosyltransferase OCH1-like enzyme